MSSFRKLCSSTLKVAQSPLRLHTRSTLASSSLCSKPLFNSNISVSSFNRSARFYSTEINEETPVDIFSIINPNLDYNTNADFSTNTDTNTNNNTVNVSEEKKDPKQDLLDHYWPVEIEHAVEWGDLDAYGHVNNKRYFAWFENVGLKQLRQLKLGSLAGTEKVGVVIAKTCCTYFKPILFPGTVNIKVRTASLGKSSWCTEYLVTAKHPENGKSEVCALGEAVIVFFDHQKQKKVPIPENVRAQIEILENPKKR